ncbi:MAG: type II secretion system inner membrane protein GspF [Kofleriaceae bacterium]
MYAYKGLSPAGKAVSGLREAESPKLLRQLLRRDGVVVTSCEVSSKGGGGKAPSKGAGKGAATAGAAKGGLSRQVDLGGLFGGVKPVDIAAFTRETATLLRAGIPLAEALGAMVEQTTNLRFKVPLGEIRAMVNEGSSLADALGKHPKLFDDLYVSMVRAGEAAGNLDDVLVRLADFMDGAQKLKTKVQSAMIYPVIMLVVGIAIVAVIMTKVVPEITKQFNAQGKVLPINTRMLIWLSDLFRDYLGLILLATVAGIIGFRLWIKSASGRPIWHRFVLRLPVVGELVRTVSVSRFARTLGTMLSAGVPMLRALDAGKEIVGNVIIKRAIDDAKVAVTEGESLATTLRKSGQFPPSTINMISVGERSGQLEDMLTRIADTYDNSTDVKLGRLTALLEPLMLVFMGGAVAFIVFSVLQPILEQASFTKH